MAQVGRRPGTKKTGGRQKGTPNAKSIEARALADRLGVDPLEILLLFAKGDWKALGYKDETYRVEQAGGVVNSVLYVSPETRANSAAKACDYLYAKRKAVEVTGADGEPVGQSVTDELVRQFMEIRAMIKAERG